MADERPGNAQLARVDGKAGPLVKAGGVDIELPRRVPRYGGRTSWRIINLSASGLIATACLALGSPFLLPMALAPFLLNIPAVMQWRRMLDEVRSLVHLADSGRLDEAVAEQERLLEATQWPLGRVLHLINLGHYEHRRGNSDRALAILSQAHTIDGLPGPLRHLIADSLAATYASIGEKDAARAWLDATAPSLTPAPRAYALAVLGEHDKVANLRWPSFQREQERFLGHERRVFHLVRAFSLAQLGRDKHVVADVLRRARSSFPSEFDYLTRGFPPLRTFLAASEQRKIVEPVLRPAWS